MQKLVAFLTILAMLSSFSTSAPLSLYMTCQLCTISCQSTYCYRVKATGYDKQICGYSSCQPTMKLNLTANQCSTTTCPSGVCISGTTMTMCDRTASSCSTPYWLNMACGSCVSDLGCDRCSITTTSFSSAPQKNCNSTCTSKASLNITILACSALPQQSGSGCSCCSSTKGYEFLLGECTSSNSFFNSSQLDKFYLNNGSTKGQAYYLMIKLFVLVTMLMILF